METESEMWKTNMRTYFSMQRENFKRERDEREINKEGGQRMETHAQNLQEFPREKWDNLV